MKPDSITPTLRLIIDRDALTGNWRALDAISGTASTGAAVKANAYGLGTRNVVPSLRDAGCKHWYVAHWGEVAGVAAMVPANQISVLHGPISSQDAQYARATGVIPVINSIFQAKLWLETGGGACDLMVDTGINRLGIPVADCADPLLASLDVRCLMSHLACADEDSAMNAAQLNKFRGVASQINAAQLSLANSAGIALGADYLFDVTRPGISLYGGVQRSELAGRIRQVVKLQAMIIQMRNLTAGDSVGYNARFTAQCDMRVGVVSIGYADGFLRAWGGKAIFEAEGCPLPVLGKVSMDMVVVDCSGAPDIGEGDFVDIPYDLPAASAQSGISQYELLTMLGQRFERTVPD
ncbi:alanine racemase [Altererythrobacter aquiaggeris]|uniref:alanine racemase n=1 Tax=Aestuarierythrobacter aquiaggeris TaxID=1898396 RepID=UPI003018B7C9